MKKDMIRFLLEVFGALLVALGLTFAICQLCKTDENTIDIEVPKGIQIANVGSSHGRRDFDYSQVPEFLGLTDEEVPNLGLQTEEGTAAILPSPLNTFNFAMTAQTFWYDATLIDYYLDHFVEGATLFIPIAYFSPWLDETEDSQIDALTARYYNLVDVDHIRFKSTSQRILHKYFDLLLQPDEWVGTIFKVHITDAEGEGYTINPKESDGYTIEEIAYLRAQYHLHYILDDEGNVKELAQAETGALEQLIENCQSRGITPVIVIPPFMDLYNQWFEIPEFQTAFYGYLNSLVEKYQIPLWDYSKDEKYSTNHELFKDSDHLSVEGAKQFTKELVGRALMEGLLSLP